jgi:hypothetical protein
MNLGAVLPLFKLAQDLGITEPTKTISPIARKITISIGKTPLILPVGFELVGPSIIGLTRPKGLD